MRIVPDTDLIVPQCVVRAYTPFCLDVRHGELTAVLVPATSETSLKDIFEDMEKIRKRAKLGRGVNVRDLIEEGRS